MCCTSEGCCVDELTKIVPSSPALRPGCVGLKIEMVLTADREFTFQSEWRVVVCARKIAALGVIRFGVKALLRRSPLEL